MFYFGCHSGGSLSRTPVIEFSVVPAAGAGSTDQLVPIEGRVKDAHPGQRIVLYARSGVWWVQPLVGNSFTAIQADSTWKGSTHPGASYAALVVDERYRPPAALADLPEPGGSVLAVNSVLGRRPDVPLKSVEFSGYQWEIRQTAGSPGGTRNAYDPSNVWTDHDGFLHLRVSQADGRWRCAEAVLTRSLGYGSYKYLVRDIGHFEPAAVLAFYTWDDSGPSREMNIEISRWGETEEKNAQFVIQPYIVPANTVRFNAPAGPSTFSMAWEPGRVSFSALRGAATFRGAAPVASHLFTSGVPSPGNERVHLNLYVFDNKQRNPLQHEFEVIIEKFEFLP